MEEKKEILFTREKHLDHMVRVVPLIVLFYALQSFLILKVAPGPFSSMSLSALGGFVAFMIGLFVTYDLYHQASIREDHLFIHFFFYQKIIPIEEITDVVINNPSETFSHLVVKTGNKNHTLYFIDDAPKMKLLILDKKLPQDLAA